MSEKLPPVPHHAPIIDFNSGRLSHIWADWFQKAFIRMGGHNAESNDDLYEVTTARIADENVTADKIAAAVAGAGLAGGAGSALSVNVDNSTIEINADALRVKALGISTAELAGSIPFAKLLSTDWTNSQAASGSQKLPSGIILKWGVTGSVSSGATQSVSFGAAFPTNCFQAIAGIRDNSAVATTATGQPGTGNYSASGFDIYNRTSVALTFNWWAVGN